MQAVRAEIDAVDRELVALLGRRFAAIRRAADLKTNPAEALVPWRVEQVLERVRAAAIDAGFDVAVAERIWQQMMSECIALERRLIAARTA
jgi:isochorismate pyruvate lyase